MAVNRLLIRMKRFDVSITEDEWELARELLNVLKIFRSSVEIFSQDKAPSLPNVMVFRLEIENGLQASANDSPPIAMFKLKILSRLDFRFPITDEILIATLLDPRLMNLPNLKTELEKNFNCQEQSALQTVYEMSRPDTSYSSSKSPYYVGPSRGELMLFHFMTC